MTRVMKKMLSVMIAVVLSLVLSITALAAQEDITITIGGQSENDKAGHEYAAYQLLTGDILEVDGQKTLTNLAFGSGVDASALKTALGLANTATVADVARELEELDGKYLAKLLEENDCLIAAEAVKDSSTPYELDVTGPGYYFINDTLTTDANKGARSAFLLKLAETEDIEVNVKTDVPTIDKKIDEGAGVEANTASIGDEVPFVLTSKVPAHMDEYNQYYFIVNDTLSKGLTFNNDVVIKINDSVYSADKYTVSSTGGNGSATQIKIVFKDFEENYALAGENIEIKYSATLNENADRTATGNPNVVNLTYSNDPNHEYNGDNEPGTGDDNVTGITPDKKTVTYTTGVRVLKVDDADKVLPGAEFELTGESLNTVIVVKSTFTKDNDGTYYALNDGTYTEVVPTEATASQYKSTTDKYKLSLVDAAPDKVESEGENIKVTVTTDPEGYAIFSGLGDGEYTLTETKAPEGYQKSEASITFEITSNPTVTAPNWKVNDEAVTIDADGTIKEFKVVNSKGINLPGTGGVGTTVFYIAGSVLVIGGIVLLISKKRMSSDREE